MYRYDDCHPRHSAVHLHLLRSVDLAVMAAVGPPCTGSAVLVRVIGVLIFPAAGAPAHAVLLPRCCCLWWPGVAARGETCRLVPVPDGGGVRGWTGRRLGTTGR